MQDEIDWGSLMTGEDTNHCNGVESQSRRVKSEGLRDKVVASVAGFILTGVIGTFLATWFQERGWAWQNEVEQVQKDSENAMASLQSVSDLLDKRWSATFQMVQAIQNANARDVSKAAMDSFHSVEHEWEVGFANVDAAVQFNVDRPFAIDAKLPKTLWALQCKTFPFGSEAEGGVNPDSANTILWVVNNCHELVKTKDINDLNKTSIDQTSRKMLIEEAYLRLSHIYHINDALRCVILERATAMRRSFYTKLGWGSFFWIGRQNYGRPKKEENCFSWYREWDEEQRKK
jgi:hypothetical protein